LVRTRWPALRALAARRGLSGRTLFGAAALPSLAYDAQNDFAARACLCHSLGYFVQELLHVLLHEPDPIFVAHHIAYLLATAPIAASDRGWPLIGVATLLAEATNPLQLAWELARAFGFSHIYERLSLPFTVAFATCRGVLMPLAFADILVGVYSRPPPGAPRPMKSATAIFVVGMGASILWLSQLVRGFLKYRRKKRGGGDARGDADGA